MVKIECTSTSASKELIVVNISQTYFGPVKNISSVGRLSMTSQPIDEWWKKPFIPSVVSELEKY
jgi:hypothetical protein